MKKTDCVLLVIDKNFLKSTIQSLNFDAVNLVVVFMDGIKRNFYQIEGADVPLKSFSRVYTRVKRHKSCLWLIGGYGENSDKIYKVKEFLTAFGLKEENIVDVGMFARMSQTWLANLQYTCEHGADFFATGNDYVREGLNLNFIPCVHKDKNIALGGVNLADSGQNLLQSFLTAKQVFEHVKPGTVKFVLIGLSPNDFCCESEDKDLNFQYLNLVSKTLSEQTDLNFDSLKKENDREFSAQAILDWEDSPKNFSDGAVEKNTQILKDYIKLCLDNGAKPVGVIFPSAPLVRKTYDQKILTTFREIIQNLEEEGDFICVDMFGLNLNYDCFSDMTRLNLRGTLFANALLSLKLHLNNLISVESFCDMTHEYLNKLAWIASKDVYNAFAEEIFNASLQKIRTKEKLKIGFVIIDAAQWCGDDVYNFFADDKRFETTIFDCLRTDQISNELVIKDYRHGVEQFEKRGLNVVALAKQDEPVPEQDILFFLTPYLDKLPKVFRSENLTLKTLATHITYSFMMSVRTKDFYNYTIFHTAWKIFFSSPVIHRLFSRNNVAGLPRGLYSGYPRMDIFFDKNVNFNFDWKMARPDAKKIIYAPHWSINSVTKQATFQWNYQFMYEFAKNHPEISWVIKPHQALFFSAVKEKVFPSAKAYEEYLQKWDDLPNAQVYTGAYYQALFATSDGMIHDSSSFIAEYQYVNKPMIFLTREGLKSNYLAKEILKVSYLVDGKDLDGIAATMQKVFIEGDDDKAAARKKIYDKYLNYPQYNGMLASEFIYKSISDELKEEP